MADDQSTHNVSESTSQITPVIIQTNLAFDPDIKTYPENLRLMATAILHSPLKNTLTVAYVVPLDLVFEASQSFKRVNSTTFSFTMLGKSWTMSFDRFCSAIKLPLYKEPYIPTMRDVCDVVNQMGHDPVISTSAEFASSKLPERWLLLYKTACNLCGKVTGSGKINFHQLAVMYAIYSAKDVDVRKNVYESFISGCRSSKTGEIMFHRFWSAIVHVTLKEMKRKDKTFVLQEGYKMMNLYSMPVPGPRRTTTKFDYVGMIPPPMIARIPIEDALRKAYDAKKLKFRRRVYDESIFDSEGKGKAKGKGKGKRVADQPPPHPSPSKKRKTKKEQKKKSPTPEPIVESSSSSSESGGESEKETNSNATLSKHDTESERTTSEQSYPSPPPSPKNDAPPTPPSPPKNPDPSVFEGLRDFTKIPILESTEIPLSDADFGLFKPEKVAHSLAEDEIVSASEDISSEYASHLAEMIQGEDAKKKDVKDARDKVLRALKRLKLCEDNKFKAVDGLKTDVSNILSASKESISLLEEKHSALFQEGIKKLEDAYDEKMIQLEKECHAKIDAARALFQKEADLLNSKATLAQQREDALAVEVKSLRSSVADMKPIIDALSGDNLKNLVQTSVQETLKSCLKDALAEEFAEQRTALSAKISDSLTPLNSLFILAETLSKKKSVASEGTGHQGGEHQRPYLSQLTKGIPPRSAFHTSFGFTSSSTGSTFAPPYSSSTVPTHSTIPSGSSSTTAASSSAAASSSSRQAKETDMTDKDKRIFIKIFKEYTKLLEGVDEKEAESHPMLKRVEMIYNAVHSTPLFFGIHPVKSILTVIPVKNEFDYGLSPKAFGYFTHHPGNNDFYGSPMYTNRMIMWYAATMNEPDSVWSIWKITKITKMAVAQKFMGALNNIMVTCERTNGMEYQFSFADLPNMNLADSLALIDAWRASISPALMWGCSYLKRYIYFFFADMARQDIELASIVTDKFLQPDHVYKGPQDKPVRVGEILYGNTEGYGLQVYYEVIGEDKVVHKRVLNMSQAPRYTSFLIKALIKEIDVCPVNVKKAPKNELLNYLHWLLEFRSRMMELPRKCFPELITEAKLRTSDFLVQIVEEPPES